MTKTSGPKAFETTSLKGQTLTEVTENLNRLIAPESTNASPDLSDTATDTTIEAVHSIESPIARAMELVGDKYSFQILHILYQLDRQRFVEIEQQVAGISPRTLSARLKHLEKFGLISRHQYPTIPPRVEYELTDCGRNLATTLNALETWADKCFPYRPLSLKP